LALNDNGSPLAATRHAFIRLQGLFRYALRRDYVDRSPVERLDCPADVEPRERVLSDAELRSVIYAARRYAYPYGHNYREI
jgi:integrase